jgi:predicted Zn-dependent protease
LSAAVERAGQGGTAESLAALNDARAATDRAIDLCRYLPDGAELLGRATLAEAHLRDDDRVALANRAEEQFLSALRDGAENVAELFVLAAECRTLIGDDDGAEAYLARAVGQDPAASPGWEAFLAFAGRTQRFERLAHAFDRAIARAEQQSDSERTGRLIAWRARLYLLQGQPFADVAAEFERALDASPNTAEIWEDYAAAARLAGDESRFAESVRNVASDLPNVEAVRTAFSGRPAEAAAELHAFAVRVSTPGAVDLTASDLAWALDYVRTAVLEPGADESALIEGLIPIAAAYEVVDLPGEAASVYLTLAERSSGATQATAAIKAGALLVRLSRADEAVDVIKHAMRTNMNNVALRIEYARALKAAGKPARARVELNMLLRQYRLDAAQQSAVEAELATL